MNKILEWIKNPILPKGFCLALKGIENCRICWLCALMIALVISFLLVAIS